MIAMHPLLQMLICWLMLDVLAYTYDKDRNNAINDRNGALFVGYMISILALIILQAFALVEWIFDIVETIKGMTS